MIERDGPGQNAEAIAGTNARNAVLSAGNSQTAAIKEDGTVVVAGEMAEHYEGWPHMTAVYSGVFGVYGIMENGFVIAQLPADPEISAGVSGWTDIRSVAECHSASLALGLKSDGTVVLVQSRGDREYDVSDWTEIVAIAAGDEHIVGLKSNGNVIAEGDNYYTQCQVSDWTDIVAVSAGDEHTVGVRADGTVVATGNNRDGQCEVSDWTDIVAVSAGSCHTVGLKSDGTVVAVGCNDDGECDVSGWRDIVAVSAGTDYTVGLKSDGTVVATGSDDYGRCDVGSWRIVQPALP